MQLGGGGWVGGGRWVYNCQYFSPTSCIKLYAGTEIFKTKHWILDIEMNQFVDGDTS